MRGDTPRALDLARDLIAEGHAVRAVTPDEAARPAVEAIGAECWIGDPDVVGTLRYALDNVTVLAWLLADDAREALHGSRWRMMLERTIDTTVRGVVYEEGTREGAAITAEMAERNEIPFAVVPARAGAAKDAVYNLLKADRVSRR